MNEAQAPVDGALYAARQKVYPRDIKGRFQRLRNLTIEEYQSQKASYAAKVTLPATELGDK